MSRTDLVISPEAELDIKEILQYTLTTWGDDQVDAYWSIIWDSLQRIRSFPEIGKQRRHAQEREFLLPHHIAIYRWDPQVNRVTILRIRSHRQRRKR
ncbi:MAG TPA: type II toxin-antitoxin system RelE/ParE family toxin [Thermomicrobiales bacterium]|nr:type II toxin-antitoxin system RelE/ParE family toxin [Thermomicrobiales bacterium]